MAGRLSEAFARGSGHGLMRLGAGEVGEGLPPALARWRDFAARYVGGLCLHASGDGDRPAVARQMSRRRTRRIWPLWRIRLYLQD